VREKGTTNHADHRHTCNRNQHKPTDGGTGITQALQHAIDTMTWRLVLNHDYSSIFLVNWGTPILSKDSYSQLDKCNLADMQFRHNQKRDITGKKEGMAT
jgi:hypothetical protein